MSEFKPGSYGSTVLVDEDSGLSKDQICDLMVRHAMDSFAANYKRGAESLTGLSVFISEVCDTPGCREAPHRHAGWEARFA